METTAQFHLEKTSIIPLGIGELKIVALVSMGSDPYLSVLPLRSPILVG